MGALMPAKRQGSVARRRRPFLSAVVTLTENDAEIDSTCDDDETTAVSLSFRISSGHGLIGEYFARYHQDRCHIER